MKITEQQLQDFGYKKYQNQEEFNHYAWYEKSVVENNEKIAYVIRTEFCYFKTHTSLSFKFSFCLPEGNLICGQRTIELVVNADENSNLVAIESFGQRAFNRLGCVIDQSLNET